MQLKVAIEFEKVVADQLKLSFPTAKIQVGNPLSKLCNSDREIDIMMVIGMRIYIIECKRLDYAESNNDFIADAGQLLGKYNKQIG